MEQLSQKAFYPLLLEWYQAWNDHNLEGVLELFHDEIIFENWDGAKVTGKRSLRRAWKNWFENHGNFCFKENETFIDIEKQKALFSWDLIWPMRSGDQNKTQTISGVDILHFHQKKIIRKNTFSKNFLKINKKCSLPFFNSKQK